MLTIVRLSILMASYSMWGSSISLSFENGRVSWTRNARPPPLFFPRSFLTSVNFGISDKFDFSVSLVSWKTAIFMFSCTSHKIQILPADQVGDLIKKYEAAEAEAEAAKKEKEKEKEKEKKK